MGTQQLTPDSLDDLRRAKAFLENPGLAMKISDLVGTPIEKGLELLPENWSKAIGEATHDALTRALELALSSMRKGPKESSSSAWHSIAAAASGAAGGLFGLPALVVELPVSTTIMLRSIADIARSEGEDLADVEARLQCLVVFALGGPSKQDDAAEAGYFTARLALAESVARAAKFLTDKGLAEKGAPALVKLITRIAQRFSVQVSEKAAAQLVPVVGAIGGAIVNTMFIDHFQEMARGHFILRRLERTYGQDAVRAAYEALPG